jgi:hypothetical protein
MSPAVAKSVWMERISGPWTRPGSGTSLSYTWGMVFHKDMSGTRSSHGPGGTVYVGIGQSFFGEKINGKRREMKDFDEIEIKRIKCVQILEGIHFAAYS